MSSICTSISTAAAVSSIVEFGHYHDSFGLAAAADCEGAGQRPALDPYGELHAMGTMTVDDRQAQGSPGALWRARSAMP